MAVDFLNAIKRPVYWRIGDHKGTQKPRFVKAPYDVVILDNEQYVQPVNRGGDGGSGAAALTTILGEDGDHLKGWQNALSDNGWVDECIYLDPAGLGNGTKDEWHSLHFFDVL